ncbi:hypothetical protein WSS_A42385 [Rhodococcus opacus M213]|uniref:Uncharacterized protein n=1 Tax=Rhodococcus opacus M213 TaxID=1129896 RepID=K8XE32_RHOOP|nr:MULTISPECIES: hypothetical protein [Rhodococcus]EKT76517.1 hypothetical protein WSS_A42385 [Rhodococcus opacus M213]GLK40707.1 hypothetical protein GCM10017611_75820 [Rhodococcus wratislaviensis]
MGIRCEFSPRAANQTLSDSGLALVCVRGPQCRWADLILLGDEVVGEWIWLARDANEIAEQYCRDHPGSGTPVS